MNASAPAEAAEACRAFERLEERGHIDAMLSRYGMLRQYLPSFLTLPFEPELPTVQYYQSVGKTRLTA